MGTVIKVLFSFQICINFLELGINVLDSFLEIVIIGLFVDQGLNFDILSFNMFLEFFQFSSFGPISDFGFDIFPYRGILMLDLKELDMNLPFESVSKMVIKGVRQYPINKFLNEFQQTVLLNLVDLGDLSFEL